MKRTKFTRTQWRRVEDWNASLCNPGIIYKKIVYNISKRSATSHTSQSSTVDFSYEFEIVRDHNNTNKSSSFLWSVEYFVYDEDETPIS